MFNFLKKIILAAFILLAPASSALAYYSPGQPSGFVNDFAGVLSAEQKTQLEQKLVAFEKDSSNEISVVTVKSLEGDTIDNFAVELFKDWGIGKKGKDNGVLILVAIADKKMRLEVGYGLEGALTDAQSSWIINNEMKPAFQQADYYTGLDNATDKIIAAAKGEYVPEEKVSSGKMSFKTIEWIIWLIILGFVWLSSILGRSKSWWAGGVLGGVAGVIIGLIKGFVFFGLISVAILIPLGLLFDFIVSRSYSKAKAAGRSYPWWIGGGGFGGGSSSGRGFGGFGGGGSGGGGSSGSW